SAGTTGSRRRASGRTCPTTSPASRTRRRRWRSSSACCRSSASRSTSRTSTTPCASSTGTSPRSSPRTRRSPPTSGSSSRATPAQRADVAWHPARPRIGDVAWLHVKNVPEGATVEGSLDGRPLTFFAYGGGQAALVGLDLEQKPGAHTWRVAVLEREREPRTARGQVQIRRRDFPVQRLQLPPAMVEPDPETERRAVLEGQRMQTLYRTITPERLWRGRFTRPVGGTEPATGFGARRIINGL